MEEVERDVTVASSLECCHSPRFMDLLEGMRAECQLRTPQEPPSWLDKERFKAGQAVFRAHSVGILLSNFRNLVIGFSIPNLCDPLVLTGNSNTPKTAFRRYLDTTYYLCKWYDEYPWEDSASWTSVNHIHDSAARRLKKDLEAEEDSSNIKRVRRRRAEKIINQASRSLKGLLDRTSEEEALFAGLEELRAEAEGKDPKAFAVFQRYTDSEVLFSQFDMAMVQLAFFSSFVSYPGAYGSRFCSEEELKDLVYVWRVVGYYLGISDRFNLASGSSFEELKNLYEEVVHTIIIPSLLHLDNVAFFMGKIVCKAFRASYPLLVYGHLYAHGVEVPGLWDALPWKARAIYYSRRIFVEVLCAFPPVRWLVCWVLMSQLDKFFKRRFAAS